MTIRRPIQVEYEMGVGKVPIRKSPRAGSHAALPGLLGEHPTLHIKRCRVEKSQTNTTLRRDNFTEKDAHPVER